MEAQKNNRIEQVEHADTFACSSLGTFRSRYGHCSLSRLEYHRIRLQRRIVCLPPPPSLPILTSHFLRIRCIIWDLNRLCYVRSMIGHSSSITALAIAPSTGVIVTADGGPSKEERKGTPTSTLNLWSINGELLASTTCADRILCVAITSGNLSLYCFINSNDRNQKEWKACAGTPSLAGSSRGRSGYGMHGIYPSCAN